MTNNAQTANIGLSMWRLKCFYKILPGFYLKKEFAKEVTLQLVKL